MGKVAINLATGSLQQQDLIVGIDLGTTNSLIAIVRSDTREPIALKEIDGLSMVPSIIHFDDYGNPTVGTTARDLLTERPSRTVYSVKRLMGKDFNDLGNETAFFGYPLSDNGEGKQVGVMVGDEVYSPVKLSAMILGELKKRAEHILKTPIAKAVITVPAYFNDVQRQATRDAGSMAGLDVLRIINEPTAASLAYGIGITDRKPQTIAVYDLGGGTFDVSILHLHEGMFEVLATNGDTYLGGDDMDNLIVQHWQAGAAGTAIAADAGADKALVQALRVAAEHAKKHLTDHDAYEGVVNGVAVSLNIKDFDALIHDLVSRTLTACQNALTDANLTTSDIDAVVMVGGSTRVPYVKECVRSFFGRELYDKINPDEVVALGAAVQADILAGNNTDMLLLDVTPLSLGIETMGGLMDVLITRNSKIPARAGRQYTTQKDGQSSMRISVFQGERDLVQDNRKLAEFNLKGIPAMPAGLPKVDISFLIDADGILKVSAKELRSGVEQTIEVKPQYGLTDEQVETMLLDSLTHATEDIQKRALVEATTEAEQMLETTRKFLKKNAQLLVNNEQAMTDVQMQKLTDAIAAEDKAAIQAETEILNELTRPFAERVMDQVIAAAMKGQKIT
jgi:molecular chaperone HscA